EFMAKAKPITVTIGDKTFKAWPQGTPGAAVKHKNSSGLQAAPKLFSTGSCGFMVPVEVGGQSLVLQCGLNLPVIGSKEWSE
ncbi:glcK, partial [Symbiodinium necroappetens]